MSYGPPVGGLWVGTGESSLLSHLHLFLSALPTLINKEVSRKEGEGQCKVKYKKLSKQILRMKIQIQYSFFSCRVREGGEAPLFPHLCSVSLICARGLRSSGPLGPYAKEQVAILIICPINATILLAVLSHHNTALMTNTSLQDTPGFCAYAQCVDLSIFGETADSSSLEVLVSE